MDEIIHLNYTFFCGRNEQQKASKGSVLGHVVQIDVGRFRNGTV